VNSHQLQSGKLMSISTQAAASSCGFKIRSLRLRRSSSMSRQRILTRPIGKKPLKETTLFLLTSEMLNLLELKLSKRIQPSQSNPFVRKRTETI
jgi:hypothetical protein